MGTGLVLLSIVGTVVFRHTEEGPPHHPVLVVADWREGALLAHDWWVAQHGRVWRLAPDIRGWVCQQKQKKIPLNESSQRKPSSVTGHILIGPCTKDLISIG